MWILPCPWCKFELRVFPRGGPYGAGEEAADRMREHVESAHDKTWQDFLWERPKEDARA
jgi:sarcosine oxidase delta subunit